MGRAADLLLDARRRTGLSRREVARRAGTSPSTLRGYETGAVEPSVAVLERIIVACGLELRTGLLEPDPHDVELARLSLRRSPVERLQASAGWAELRTARQIRR